ncbi:hypothetical protein B0H34DRAFT_485499 [Crassisporium funariophilum]|nr:hypothetical protein B0H34DRAFT_485499 [Crassisporium funariophilum]
MLLSKLIIYCIRLDLRSSLDPRSQSKSNVVILNASSRSISLLAFPDIDPGRAYNTSTRNWQSSNSVLRHASFLARIQVVMCMSTLPFAFRNTFDTLTACQRCVLIFGSIMILISCDICDEAQTRCVPPRLADIADILALLPYALNWIRDGSGSGDDIMSTLDV